MEFESSVFISEKTSGSKMLKKAKSFRDDVKNKLKRRPSSSAADHSMTEIREYSRSNSRTSSRQNSRNNSVSKEEGVSCHRNNLVFENMLNYYLNKRLNCHDNRLHVFLKR